MAVTYSIVGGPDADKFNIDAATGELSFKVAPDFENPGSAAGTNDYRVTVGATDPAAAMTTQDRIVTVTDVNEAPPNQPPQFTSPANVSVPENQTEVDTVQATDPDEAPPVSGWPNALTTGAKGTLTASGGINTSSNGQIIQNLDVAGAIRIVNNHSGVLIKNCRAHLIAMVDGNGNVTAGANCTIEDCTITGNGSMQQTGIQFGSANGIVRRCDVSGVENGINIEAVNGGTVRDCYIHDLASPGNPDPHYDGIPIQGNQHNILIDHNNIVHPSGLNACVFIKTDWGPISNIRVNNNRMIGGSMTVYADNSPGAGMTGIEFTNNRMGGWFYGPALVDNASPVWTGNVNDATGEPITSY